MFGIIKAIAAIGSLLDALTRAVKALEQYLADKRAEKVSSEIDKSVQTGDQTPIEVAIGSTNAGKPTQENIPDLKTRPVGDHSPVVQADQSKKD